MREIVLDTETTGLDPEKGDRLVEIGCVELLNHMPTGATYHQYINPQRDMPIEAFNVHGLSEVFLADKPLFPAVVDEFLAFIGESKLIIHNASFDMKFLNAELRWAERAPIPMSRALDTLEIARRKFPGAQNSLDALCRRFGVDNAARTLHGALLDSEILAEVYLELIGGRQPDFALSVVNTNQNTGGDAGQTAQSAGARPSPLPARLTDAERAAHTAFIDELGDAALWKTLS